MKFLVTLLFVFSFGYSFSQNTTILLKNQKGRESNQVHKVLIIPFEPKLYMGEVDREINAETHLSAKEIKYKFRDGLNQQIQKAFLNEHFGALDLMEDTGRYRKDIETIYEHLSYEYQKVPDQEKYKQPETEKKQKHIQKGQLVVETNADKRFMNAKINDPKLIPVLNSKYKSDLFVFVNQLDIKMAGNGNFNAYEVNNAGRKIVVHYTVLNNEMKEINSGLLEEEFENDLNNPKKIIDKHFSRLASALVERVNKCLAAQGKDKE